MCRCGIAGLARADTKIRYVRILAGASGRHSPTSRLPTSQAVIGGVIPAKISATGTATAVATNTVRGRNLIANGNAGLLAKIAGEARNEKSDKWPGNRSREKR